ncbi:hypothetical protein THAOC_07398 [Thalassiosira oceanica]|uniref:Uncharacterized protein n=1 Tax=Thalassiosira oceanica TaxID=159749 RepID=K0TCM6_THAOC|nr:hypothetical protein THAOC_07398 [Thalassiosira oceanica]|eukprot:EJK71186.1 hypothetical protein THAOC_07398 [Thalassiosira oceanica]
MKFFTLVSVLAFALESGAEVASLRGNSFEEQAHEASLTEVREKSGDALTDTDSAAEATEAATEAATEVFATAATKVSTTTHTNSTAATKVSTTTHTNSTTAATKVSTTKEPIANITSASVAATTATTLKSTMADIAILDSAPAMRRYVLLSRPRRARITHETNLTSQPTSSTVLLLKVEQFEFETFLQAVEDESLGGLCDESSCMCCNPIGSHYEVDTGSYCPAGFCDSDEEVDDFEDLMEAVEESPSLRPTRSSVSIRGETQPSPE